MNRHLEPLTREERVAAFYRAAGVNVKSLVDPSSRARIMRAFQLIEEEFKEIDGEIIRINSKHNNGKVIPLELVMSLIKEMADLQYVLSAFAVEFGIDLQLAFNLVHQSNMTKIDDEGQPFEIDETGKVRKGPRYEEPNLEGVPFEGKARCHREAVPA